MQCPKCERHLEVGEWPFCPHGFPQSRLAVQGDEVDFWVENMGRHPVHIRSKAEHKRLMRERGLKQVVRHVEHPAGPKYNKTVNWAAAATEKELRDATELMSRAARLQSPEVVEVEGPLFVDESRELEKSEARRILETHR